MKDCREPGKIILINGASSAGKSTLACSLQQQLPEPFLHWSFDHLRASNTLPMACIRNGELDWARIENHRSCEKGNSGRKNSFARGFREKVWRRNA